VGEYVVESYGRADSPETWRGTIEGTPRNAGPPAEAVDVRYVRSLLIPEDEACFHVFIAPSRQAIAATLEGAGIGFDRIVGAHEFDALSSQLWPHEPMADRGDEP
jgi:hypothetical protein